LTVRESHDVQLWNWREAHRVAPEIPRRSVLHHASLSPNGSNILTTARSGYAHVYDSASSQLLYQFEYAGGLLDTTYAPDGRHIATACHDGNVWVRESDSDDPHPMVLPEGNQIEQIAFSADGLRLAVAARGGHARVWELFPPQRGVRRLPGTDVDAVEFDSSGRRALLLNLGEKRGLSLYDVHSGELVWTSNFSSDQVSETRFSPDGGRILAFGSGRAVRVLDADSGRELVPPMKHNSRLTDAVWSPDGKWILSAARTGNALAWDSTTGKPAMTFSNSNPIVAIAVSPDGQRFVTGHGDNTIQLWDIRTGRPETAGFKGPGNIRRIHFSTDGKLLAISGCPRGEEGIVEIRDVQSGKVVGNSLVHRNGVNFFEFSRDGRWLATACDDHNARIWNGTNGEAVSAWLPHEHEARQVNFSPDGTRLVTLARRGAVRLWSVPSGEPITAPILYHRNRGDGAVSYSPDGQRLLIARGGNEAWVRELQPEMTTIQELRLLAQSLSCTKFDPASGMVPLDESGMAEAWQRLRSLHAGH
jgi:WD40 repeat protein